ncbi:ThiF family adenylyltransferase [Candidatus Uhrbacteria bacterium]|nr:ThiF family adenylyltransferase [Candidatus Uhrbacteria bacterium]
MQAIIIGCGGIGSHLAGPLARYLESLGPGHKLTLVDGDNFEDRNKTRQVFDRPGNKAQSVAAKLAESHPGLTVDAVPEFIKPDNAEFILDEGVYVMLCVDNHPTRKLVSEAAASYQDIAVISGGNELEDGMVQIYVRKGGVDATPPLTHDHPEIADPKGKAPYEMSCEELAKAGTPQIIFANLTAAVLMANAFWRLSTDPEGFLTKTIGKGEFALETAYTEVAFNIGLNKVRPRRTAVTTGGDAA